MAILKKILEYIKKIQYNSPVILTYALVSLAVLGISALTDGQSNLLLFSVYRASWSDPLAYIRVITYALGHMHIQHYFNNFLLILLVGPLLEERYGSKKLLIMIGATSLITGIAFLLIGPSNTAGLGASGVAFMLILLASVTNAAKGRLPLTLLFALAVYVGAEVFNEVRPNETGISHVSHIIGGLCGAAFGLFLGKERDKKS
ncbi:MAG: rhomboid family intramembrane serine protease [Defluviitaleaceae bacterium]|nr:rhomboid family intramembrane serine protease [Defluviitaleaceae bacterium]MCL2835466.1 rhomboid family intramembrane serine protease [Defluviitaleaceae bacterium]